MIQLAVFIARQLGWGDAAREVLVELSAETVRQITERKGPAYSALYLPFMVAVGYTVSKVLPENVYVRTATGVGLAGVVLAHPTNLEPFSHSTLAIAGASALTALKVGQLVAVGPNTPWDVHTIEEHDKRPSEVQMPDLSFQTASMGLAWWYRDWVRLFLPRVRYVNLDDRRDVKGLLLADLRDVGTGILSSVACAYLLSRLRMYGADTLSTSRLRGWPAYVTATLAVTAYIRLAGGVTRAALSSAIRTLSGGKYEYVPAADIEHISRASSIREVIKLQDLSYSAFIRDVAYIPARRVGISRRNAGILAYAVSSSYILYTMGQVFPGCLKRGVVYFALIEVLCLVEEGVEANKTSSPACNAISSPGMSQVVNAMALTLSLPLFYGLYVDNIRFFVFE
mmetsp:Transcript_12493/g.35284  ORF Transcript_12493/g.35284 Transcript_12493/m.35284 type:complete len:397 (+) Transcript_12493:149-1339(+)|eukprot:CAMPEP_0119154728 /NCGR_PEP_ID=MMETSP1310-20130426/51199_1 /TAXON_ID=464262 /ORGANISM="Genus nov. species nov., Strain RCC2339" /LENGTH=396 /DNA_ID=CAMNT_0007147281 /DNA_START=78 /DNA_END=1268 /DNA_ORIENTATION=-